MEKQYDDSWAPVLKPLFAQPYMKQLSTFVQGERRQKKVFPPAGLVMNAFKLTPLDEVKVVILGQDPYIMTDRRMDYLFLFRKELRCRRP